MGGWRHGGVRLGLAGVAVLAVVSVAVSVAVAPGSAAAASAAASSQRWTGSKLPLPPGAGPNTFRPLAISCSSAARCAGGGGYAVSSQDFAAALLTLSGTKWTDADAPLPAGASYRLPGTAVASAACPAATTCFAGGDYQNSSGNQAMVLAWSGKRWSAAEAPLPRGANSNPDATISGISCPSATWCTAVGQYDASTQQYGLLLRRSKGRWTAAAAPVAAGAEAVGTLNAVSCPSVARCFAGGWDYAEYGASQQLLLLTWWKNKWAVVNVALPRNAAANPEAVIDAVACPTATRCIAAGSYETSAGDQEGVLLGWAGRAWTTRTAPVPANAGADPWTSLNAAACPVSSRCVVGGEYEDAASQPHGLLLTWSKNKWTAAEAPAGYDVHAISCPSATRCYALSALVGGLELLTGP
jgi:hypothetical protein